MMLLKVFEFTIVNVFLSDIHAGRKRELIIASLLYFTGGLMTAYAPELGVLLIGRLLYGLGIGMVIILCFPCSILLLKFN